MLVLDRTEWHFGATPVNVLMIGIAHRGIAFPIAWTALPKGGGSGSGEQIEVLEAALSALDASDVEALTTGRELISVLWLKRLQAVSISFVIRLRSGRRLYLSEDGPLLSANMYARACLVGTSRALGPRTLEGTEGARVPVQVLTLDFGNEAMSLVTEGSIALEAKESVEIKGKSVLIESEKDTTVDAGGNLAQTAGKDATVEAKGSAMIDAKKDFAATATNDATLEGMNVSVKGDQQFAAEGAMNAQVKGGQMLKLQGGTMTDVKGGMVKLNS